MLPITTSSRLSIFFLLIIVYSCTPAPPKTSGAGKAMEYWDMLRSYPDGLIHSSYLHRAHEQWRPELGLRNNAEWRSLGPKNIGGRTLCLAFHPLDSNLIYAGSAGGGLWVTRTAGKGPQAWKRVFTGHPVLSVSTIAINPERPEELFIGTGEVYNYQSARPGIDDRFNRGSYGMGILRSIDGGQTWQVSLDWRQSELRGVWKIIFNPRRSATLLAATTEGIYRSRDRGNTWQQLSDRRMATDLEIHPVDTNIIYAGHGGYRSPETGIYRSLDGGETFELLQQLPFQYTGKAAITLVPAKPDWIYASIADDLESIGLFRSTDQGRNWTLLNTQDVAKWQGWYAHDIAVHPEQSNTLMYVGIDAWRSFDGGKQLNQRSYWQAWQFGQTGVGEPEGPANYVHADIHAAYYHPANSRRVFLATDGGIFESINAGTTWSSRNGGYQTQQFYADFASAPLDSNLAIGGLQDNSTVIYSGSDAWARRIGGDGMSAAIDPENDQFIYGSLQNLRILRSSDRGETFRRLAIGNSANEKRNFNGPFVLAPSQPSKLYAGAQRLYVSNNRGGTWQAASAQTDGDNVILKIAVAPNDPDLLYFSTNSLTGTQAPAVFKSTSAGRNDWMRMQGLPEQLCTDLVFHPTDPEQVYAVFGGFNTEHVFRTLDGGQSWTSIDHNLPDLPTHTLFIDPEQTSHLYIGNDLGVFASQNDGQSWEWISQDIAEAVMVMDLSYSPENRRLRVATHGLGAYELALDQLELTAQQTPLPAPLSIALPYPNPTRDWVYLDLAVETGGTFSFELVDVTGRSLESYQNSYESGASPTISFDLQERESGIYWVVIRELDSGFQSTYSVVKR